MKLWIQVLKTTHKELSCMVLCFSYTNEMIKTDKTLITWTSFWKGNGVSQKIEKTNRILYIKMHKLIKNRMKMMKKNNCWNNTSMIKI